MSDEIKINPKKATFATGFMVTDKNMIHDWFQYNIGEWYEFNGEIELNYSGFHFYKYLLGCYRYNGEEIRIFKIEAKEVLISNEPGICVRHTCKRIKLIEEIEFDRKYNIGSDNTGKYNIGNNNTGYGNIGDFNSGNDNSGCQNPGDYNTGNNNTGSHNRGSGNSGNYNTGNINKGNCNKGNYNTGGLNIGDNNLGDRNVGNLNTGNNNIGDENFGIFNIGNYNTGSFNIGNNHDGYFCIKEKGSNFVFDEKIEGILEVSVAKQMYYLYECMMGNDKIYPEMYENIPNATEEKIENFKKRLMIEMMKTKIKKIKQSI